MSQKRGEAVEQAAVISASPKTQHYSAKGKMDVEDGREALQKAAD
jgi:hypothetical protein